MTFIVARLPLRLREIVSYRAGRAVQGCARHAGQWIILAYHNVRPAGSPAYGERTLHVAERSFARQLDLLQRTHDVRPLSDLAVGEPRGKRPVAVITFDDAYRGALSTAVAELSRRELPATFFVVPGRLGDHTYWWDRLAEHFRGVIPEEVRRHVLEGLGGEEGAIAEWAAGAGIDLTGGAPDYARTVTELELRRAATNPGITIAPHTWSHPNLTTLPAGRLDDELGRSKAWVQERFSRTPPWISFPYGRSSELVEAAAMRAGYVGGVRIHNALAWIDRPEALRGRPWVSVPRLNIPAECSFEGFALAVSGAWGV